MSAFTQARWNGKPELRPWVYGVIILVVIVGFIFGCTKGVLAVQRTSCEQKADAMHRKYDYGAWKGCLVQADDGTMIPLSNYRLSHVEGGK